MDTQELRMYRLFEASSLIHVVVLAALVPKARPAQTVRHISKHSRGSAADLFKRVLETRRHLHNNQWNQRAASRGNGRKMHARTGCFASLASAFTFASTKIRRASSLSSSSLAEP